jgi:hypothetical protein
MGAWSGGVSISDRVAWGGWFEPTRCALDIPRLHLSSGEPLGGGPGDVFPIRLASLETSVKDPHETIAQRAERLAVGFASVALPVVEVASTGRFRQARERPEIARRRTSSSGSSA